MIGLPKIVCVAVNISNRITYSKLPIETGSILNEQAQWLIESGFNEDYVLDYISSVKQIITDKTLTDRDLLWHAMKDNINILYEDG